MGNYKFRLSDMMPNAWFYKLKNGGAAQPVKNNNNHKNLQYHHHHLITPTPTPYHQTAPPQISHPRHSYYFTREPYTKSIDTNDQVLLDNSSPIKNPKVSDLHYIAATEPPRKSSKRSRPKTRIRTVSKQSAVSCNCREHLSPSSSACKSDSTPDYSAVASPELLDSPESAESVRVDTNSMPMSMSGSSISSCSCGVSASTTDIIIDMTDIKKSSSAGFDPITELELPRIITKAPTKFIRNTTKEKKSGRRIPARKDTGGEKNVHGSLSSKEQKSSPCVRKSISAGSPGLKLRSNSPRILTRKVRSKDTTMRTFLGAKPNRPRTTNAATTTTGTKKPAVTAVWSMNKNVSDSFAIIKSSYDPQRDFRESMVEMIVENDLRKSGDLEELLACYLSLNSNEYHDVIVKVFEQIWFHLTDIR